MKTRIVFIALLVGALEIKSDFSRKFLISPLMLDNVEALAADESSSSYTCIGSGSVDCPVTGVKVKIIYEGYRLEKYN